MPRLSLWREHKSNDFKFLDRSIREQFHVGGTGVYVHKYLGPDDSDGYTGDPSKPNYLAGEKGNTETTGPSGSNETHIQDLLFLENRDRKYDPDIYELRGVYNVGDQDFDLTQFGLFLANDVVFMTFHINDMVEKLGRRLMPGDVVELPHLRDDLLLDEDAESINKFYVVQDAARGAEGYSQTWWPHIWRVKMSPMTDAQEYRKILGYSNEEGSLASKMSTFEQELNISDAVVEAAEQADPIGVPLKEHLFGDALRDESVTTGGVVNNSANFTSYEDYLGESVQSGVAFPANAFEGQFFVRTDFNPNRLFVRRGSKWVRLYDNVPGTQSWTNRTYNGDTFINNQSTDSVGNSEFPQKQGLSKVILPKADNYGTQPTSSTTDLTYVDDINNGQYADPGYVDNQ